MLCLFEGPELRKHYREDREEKKAQHQVEFKPMTSLLKGVRSSNVLQLLPMVKIEIKNNEPMPS